MTKLRIRDAAVFLGVSDDTVRRWVDAELIPHEVDQSRRKVIDGRVLAEFAQSLANPMPDPSEVTRSARNRFVGLVTQVVSDKVMSQVELQCGPFRVVSLMSTEAVRELALEPGSVAVAVVKATNVMLETPHPT
jgi:molybdopterin-binding protein